jgi:hypothetical protein
MSAKKFEKMIECIVNDDEAKAKALFHDIIVEKSRQIYESMMAEDQSMGFMDEIESEENGSMMEDEFETDEEISGDYDVEGGDEEFDMDDEEDMEDDEFEMDAEEDDMGEEDEDGLEDRVVDLEDKLDQLMADFEAQMGDEEVEVDSEEEFDDEDGEEEFDSEEEVMESVEQTKVSVTHGDNGVQTKSTVRANSGAQGMASKPVNFSTGGAEAAPKSASKPSNVYSKGEKKMGDGASLKNVDGAYKFNEKGEAAPKATKTSPAGTNTRSAVPESKRTTKKRI